MCRRCGGRTGRRRLFPEQTPPGLNYAVVTGTLLDDPREGGGPGGTPVLVMEIEFPVADPEHPQLLWTYATYEVEVPGDVGGRHVEELRKGAPVLVAGRLSERCSLEDGRASCRGTIVANLIHPGPPPEQPGGVSRRKVHAVTRRAPTSAPPTPEMKVRFGENLARCREGADVSQEELSFRASIHRTEVSLLERGERMPRVDTALRIAGSLGVAA